MSESPKDTEPTERVEENTSIPQPVRPDTSAGTETEQNAPSEDNREETNDGNDDEEDNDDDGDEEDDGNFEDDQDQAEYDEEEVYKLKRHRREPGAQSESKEGAQKTERKRAPKATAKENTPPRRSRKPRTQEPEPEIEEEVDESVRERRALEAKIDAALQPSSKRRKKLAGDDLEMMQDEAIANLRDKMRAAALADVESIREGRPAVEKVKMLPEVVQILQRNSLADSILDGNLLESVRIWLEPLQDASLPSFEIQKVLFEALVQLPIKTIHLRESGLGRVVLFYQKSKRPQPMIKRMAQKLIGDWTRPIIGRSDNYRDKRVVTADFDPREIARVARTDKARPQSSYEEAAARQNRAAIPSASGISYQVAPVSNTGAVASQQSQTGSSSKDSQLRRMKTKLMASGRSGKKKSQVSVEGKDLN